MTSDKQISNYVFSFICNIAPEIDRNEAVIEYMPQARYHDANNSPLNKYGNGPFCKFSISRKTGNTMIILV